MKSKAPLLVLVGAIVFGLLAAVSVSSYLARARANNKLNNIIVAKIEIPLGAKITAEHLTSVAMPLGATPEGSFSEIDKLVGRVAATRISAREAIIGSRLAPVGAVAGLSSVIPEGYRAMTVKVEDDSGLSGFVLPGTFVDVAAVIKLQSNYGGGDSISKIILQNIKVLANGDNLDEPEDKRDAQKARTVTLQVMPDQAEKLLLASADGRLRLVMRNGVDQNQTATQGANVETLLQGDNGLPTALSTAYRQAQTAPVQAPAPVAAVPARKTERYPKYAKVPSPVISAETPITAPVSSRNEVEFFEGMKKRTVEFPER